MQQMYESMSNKLISAFAKLDTQLKATIKNKAVILWIIVIMVIIAFFAYAVYCTSRGYSFSGGLKFNWPRFFDMGIACKR